jgi:hypothetical protein
MPEKSTAPGFVGVTKLDLQADSEVQPSGQTCVQQMLPHNQDVFGQDKCLPEVTYETESGYSTSLIKGHSLRLDANSVLIRRRRWLGRLSTPPRCRAARHSSLSRTPRMARSKVLTVCLTAAVSCTVLVERARVFITGCEVYFG